MNAAATREIGGAESHADVCPMTIRSSRSRPAAQATSRHSLIRYDAARRALAGAHRVDEVKRIRDKAVAMQCYAKQAKDTSLITQATEIRMRAERRAGELLIEMAERKERHSGRAHTRTVGSRAATPRAEPKLADLGINKTQSSRWQRLATLDADIFEVKVAAASRRAYDRIAQRFVKEVEVERAQRRHRSIIEHGCTVDDLVALAASGKRFPTILGDPAWPWSGQLGSGMSRADHHFGLSTLDEIKSLPVASLAADDCALLLWCTGPHIAIGSHVEVIRAWGFKPSTVAFVWIKENKSDGRVRTRGQGCWTTANAEICFIATKGSPLRLAFDVHQVVMAPVGEHSKKPAAVRQRIQRLFGGPYLELFAREPVAGWTTWGNEIPREQFGSPILEAAE